MVENGPCFFSSMKTNVVTSRKKTEIPLHGNNHLTVTIRLQLQYAKLQHVVPNDNISVAKLTTHLSKLQNAANTTKLRRGNVARTDKIKPQRRVSIKLYKKPLNDDIHTHRQ